MAVDCRGFGGASWGSCVTPAYGFYVAPIDRRPAVSRANPGDVRRAHRGSVGWR